MKISFDKELLLYDVANTCFVLALTVGRGRNDDGDDGRMGALIADVADEGNRDIMRRSLDMAFSEVAWAVGGWPSEVRGDDGCVTDNRPLCEEKYEMDVDLPEGGGDALRLRVVQVGHRYMVERAVRDWLMLVAPGITGGRSRGGEELLEELRGLRVYGVGKARIRPRPF